MNTWTNAAALIAGICLMCGALVQALRLAPAVKSTKTRKRWVLQLVLIGAFLLGYVASLVLVFVGRLDVFAGLTTVIFAAGALFVLLSISLAQLLTAELRASALVLQSQSDVLLSSNKNLAASVCALQLAQDRALQSEKIAAVGQLVAGVAHEINNPLAIILGFAQGMERRMPEADALRMPIASIVREASRCKSLVHELLSFSRTGKKTTEELDLNALVRSTAILLGARATTDGVEIVQELDPHLLPFFANRTQIQQIIINLGTNALDAMSGVGKLTLSTRLMGDGKVLLVVADTGTGIPEDVRSRIFDPFFTTKDAGKGTGLGLSLVHEIVHQHQGSIRVETEPGKGTMMLVELPTPSGSPDGLTMAGGAAS